jgi:hypothetical protein
MIVQGGAGTHDQRGIAATEFWVSPGWSDGLAVEGGRRWPDVPVDDGTSGMVTVAAPSSNRRRRVTSALGQQIAGESSPHSA